MTTMPPEMSTATAAATVNLPPTAGGISRDSLTALTATRSRFMITDILAGSAVAAAAAMQNGINMTAGRRSPSKPTAMTAAAPTTLTLQQQHQLQQQQQQQAALQHYIAQQQHLLQQHQQNYHNAAAHSKTPLSTTPPAGATAAPQTTTAATTTTTSSAAGHPQQNAQLTGSSSSTLMSFPATAAAAAAAAAAALNGLQSLPVAAQTHTTTMPAHYAALREERERERLRELHTASAIAAGNDLRNLGLHQQQQQQHLQQLHHHHHQQQQQQQQQLHLQHHQHHPHQHHHLLEHDERSRSPQPVGVSVRDLSSNAAAAAAAALMHHTTGGSSSISGDQASTIDDSDSDTCGAKDDDGNSIKSDNLMGLTKKQRKARTAFTDHQLQTLEKSFERQKYLSVQDRMELANKLELSDCQVKTWYQNRRTKWKRQTAVGLELLAEAGNYAAFQRLYGSSPYLSAWPYAAAQPPHSGSPTAIDLYYRQAAAAAVLQKPLSYRMYPTMPPMAGLGGMPIGAPHQPHPQLPPPPHLTHLSASNSLTSLSSYYQNGQSALSGNGLTHLSGSTTHSPAQSSDISDKQRQSVELTRTPSPQLNPGSPPERYEHNRSCTPVSEDDEQRHRHAAAADADDEDDDDNAAIEV